MPHLASARAWSAPSWTASCPFRGFLQSRYESDTPLLLPVLQSWFEAGDLRLIEDITPGLGHLPAALEGLMAGANLGKVLIDITKEES